MKSPAAVEDVRQVLVAAAGPVIIDREGVGRVLVARFALALAHQVTGPGALLAAIAEDVPPPVGGEEQPAIFARYVAAVGLAPEEEQVPAP